MHYSDKRSQINTKLREYWVCFASFSPSGCHRSFPVFTVISRAFPVKTPLKSRVPYSAPHTAAAPARFGFGQTDMSELNDGKEGPGALGRGGGEFSGVDWKNVTRAATHSARRNHAMH